MIEINPNAAGPGATGAFWGLPDVTLCAASDIALEATLRALEHCCTGIRFHDVFLLSSVSPPRQSSLARHVKIPPIGSKEEYSRFILQDLAKYIESSHALIVQWDGFIVAHDRWDPAFLEYDYIGAPWPNFAPPRNVGNGGFSLRSKRLLEAGSQKWFRWSHPEDLCISHENRNELERRNFRIADEVTAHRFAFERGRRADTPFGAHGIFALAELLSETDFDDLLAHVDYGVIGNRELRDLVEILKRRNSRDKTSLRRCRRELFTRYPFSWKSARSLLGF